MSEEQESKSGYINILLTETDITYDSDLNIKDIVFWLTIVKSMLVKKLIDTGQDNG